MSRKFKRHKKVIRQDWLMTYSDTVTLLMAFFIILLSVSTIDGAKVDTMQEGLSKTFFKKEYTHSFKELENQIQDVINTQNMSDHVTSEASSLGIKLRFSNQVVFESGSAALLPGIKETLNEISQLIREQGDVVKIEVEGHTDNQAIHTRRYPSNWELSTARASNVVRFFIDSGLPKNALKASGYADTQPEASNDTVEGRGKNRRVEVLIHRTFDIFALQEALMKDIQATSSDEVPSLPAGLKAELSND